MAAKPAGVPGMRIEPPLPATHRLPGRRDHVISTRSRIAAGRNHVAHAVVKTNCTANSLRARPGAPIVP